MSVIGFSVALLALTLIAHLLWWRIRPPRRQTSAVLAFFLAALPVGLAIAWFAPSLRHYGPKDVWDALLVAQFHVACTLAYTCINSAIQDDSPSVMVTTFVALSGPEGCTADDVLRALDDDLMIRPRLQQFAGSGMIELRDGRYFLTERGMAFTRWLALLRRIYRLEKVA